MRTILFISCCFMLTVLYACHDYRDTKEFKELYSKHKSEPSVELIVSSDGECTSCLDVKVDSGIVPLPRYFKRCESDSFFSRELDVVGKFPHEYYFPGGPHEDFALRFKIRGKLIGYSGIHGCGCEPLFYVEDWERFDKHGR